MANEPTKTGSASLITREAQVNPIVTCQLTPTRLAIIKNNHREPVLARMWRLGTLCLGGGNVQGYHRHGKHKSDLSKIKYGITIQFSDSTSGFISEKEGKQELEQVSALCAHGSALHNSKGWKRHLCPSMDEIHLYEVPGGVTFVESRWWLGFPGASVVKNLSANAGDTGSIPGWGSSPGEGNGNPLQCSSLENAMDRGAWQAMVHGVIKSWTRLSD